MSTSLDDIASDASLSPDSVKHREELVMDCASVMYAAATDSVRLLIFFLLPGELTSSAALLYRQAAPCAVSLL